ncbi:MAG: hypothetical protein Q7R45_11740 [Sulfuricaulis sp.]|nr:hypothetical protein [Sulfuricaulis sp.]
MSIEFISGSIGFLLTLMVLSYIIGDGPLFRIAVYIFIGVSAGYFAVVAFYQVITPGLLAPLLDGSTPAVTRSLLLFPLVLGGMMLMKISPRFAQFGTPATAYLVGVSAAVIVGGAVMGTIFPQVLAAADPFSLGKPPESLLNGLVMIIATVTTLAYFQFGARRQQDGTVKRNPIIETVAWVGGIFVALTLGALFAGVYSAALTALVERINSILQLLFSFMGLS